MKRRDAISSRVEAGADPAFAEAAHAEITVLVGERRPILREALSSLIDRQEGMTVVAACGDGADAVAAVAETLPAVAVLAALPGGDAVAATAEIRRCAPSCTVLVLLSSDRPGHVRRTMDAGAAGLLPMDASLTDLTGAIRKLATGGRHVDPELAAAALSAGVNPLTEREQQALSAAADGAPVEAVARALFVSPGTARNHLSSAIRKLGAHNRIEAARMADHLGWLVEAEPGSP